jgi:hypothetical protein
MTFSEDCYSTNQDVFVEQKSQVIRRSRSFLDWNTFWEMHHPLNSDATVEQKKIAKKKSLLLFNLRNLRNLRTKNSKAERFH